MASSSTSQEEDLLTEPHSNLIFLIPLKGQSCLPLRVANLEEEPVAFKVKTTLNDRYRIRPSIGLIEGLGSSTVSISCLQVPTKPAHDDKIIVVLTKLPPGFDVASYADQWEAAEAVWTKQKDSNAPVKTKTLNILYTVRQ